jgi:adenosylcobalamin-dependent ribonucleoside-triphosphate reductase
MYQASTRAAVITRRTYNRPLNDEGTVFETWKLTVARVIDHQQWLWERAKGSELNDAEFAELYELEELMLDRKVSMSGRTLWLGGTQISKYREASQFNCSYTNIETVYDIVDSLWLLLQGCGLGVRPIVGTLNGFVNPIEDIQIIPSTRTTKGGLEYNEEFWDVETGIWRIKIGDSAEAWAKSIGKLIAGKYPAKTLILDFSELRPAGERLKGYGWISSGYFAIAKAYKAIAEILSSKADSLLSRIDIMDIINWLGTILSSRRSAEIVIFEYGQPEWEEFAVAKKDWWLHDNAHRTQSNNSLLFKEKPTIKELTKLFQIMEEAGGSEPGFINGEEALRRAPWFQGCNPCVEILLGSKSFCNLTEIDIGKFKKNASGLHRAAYLAARANYRQTCVNLKDGILQESWHLNNAFLRLCGVGLTGIAKRPDMKAYDYQYLQRTATSAAIGMADELKLPHPKNVTTVKPSGTLSKIMDTTEGAHMPLGKYIFNNVQFSKFDPVVEKLRNANYNVINHPTDDSGVLVTFPVKWDDVPFHKANGKEVNLESAIDQLERYKLLQKNWTQQNTSVTISYDPSEVEGIVQWLYDNWDIYVGVSFLYRTDPTKTAKDLGYLYLPQEVVTEDEYNRYVATLLEVDLEDANSFEELRDEGCATGACPIR